MANKNIETAPAAAPAYNPWNDRVPVYLPKATDGDQQFVFVCVNDKGFQVPRGKRTLAPRPVYGVLTRSEYAQQITESYDEANKNVEKIRG